MNRLHGTMWVVLILALVTACHAPIPTRLVMVGGGLSDDNALVYRAFLDHAAPDRPVIVLPTASGVPNESGPGTVRKLQTHGAPAATDVLMVADDRPADPNDAERLASAGAIWLTGGKQSRIMQHFSAEPTPSHWRNALNRAVRTGAIVGGTSAGAAAMSNPMITGGRSADALVHGIRSSRDEPGVGVAEGLGLFTNGIVDQHVLARGRLGRLIIALEQTGTPFGFGIAENAALVADDGGRTLTVIGDPGVVFIDMRDAERNNENLSGIRVSLLCTGDTIVDAAVVPSPSSQERRVIDPHSAVSKHDDLWGRHTCTDALRDLATFDRVVATTSDQTQRATFAHDANTKIYQGASSQSVRVINALLTLEVTGP